MKENDPPVFMSNDLRDGFGLDHAQHEAPVVRDYQPVKDPAKVEPEQAEAAEGDYVAGAGGKMSLG